MVSVVYPGRAPRSCHIKKSLVRATDGCPDEGRAARQRGVEGRRGGGIGGGGRRGKGGRREQIVFLECPDAPCRASFGRYLVLNYYCIED